jgi:hypothetical protein
MSELRFENPETAEDLRGVLLNLDVVLPLHPSPDDLGVLLDVAGRDVLTIDVNNHRDDDQVVALTAYICMAINTCGGFRAIAAVVDDLKGGAA